MSKIVTKGPRRLVDDMWHDDNGPLPVSDAEWDPPMTDEEITLAALADPDAQPLTDAQLARMRRVGLHGAIRFRLRLTHDEFATRYHVPADTLHDWERGRATPYPIAATYLVLIDADPEGVAETLARQQQAAAAE